MIQIIFNYIVLLITRQIKSSATSIEF